jgi:hypothetical protein
MSSRFELTDALLAFERSEASTPRGYKRLAKRLAHQLTALPLICQVATF